MKNLFICFLRFLTGMLRSPVLYYFQINSQGIRGKIIFVFSLLSQITQSLPISMTQTPQSAAETVASEREEIA